ncbi:MAG: glutathione S-transferase [Rhodobacteraceae bacterium]|nr:glutathione S-transferase [Paracoccaceae bacterium]
MTAPVTLHGYHRSIYAWAALLALAEKGVEASWVETDPFAPGGAEALHPFGRVPVLVHGAAVIYETAAICQYVDEGFPGPPLQPADPLDRARMRQIISVADAYAYWPMVRQVYAEKVFAGHEGRAPDAAMVREGLRASRRALDALEALTGPGLYLLGGAPGLADVHLAPMVAAFARAPEGAALLAGRPRLHAWSKRMAARESFRSTFVLV